MLRRILQASIGMASLGAVFQAVHISVNGNGMCSIFTHSEKNIPEGLQK